MTEKPKIIIYVEQTFTVGEDTFVDSTAENDSAVIFEDNTETGYFYAIDRSEKDLKILDALHIYNVENVVDKDKPSVVKILWSEDLTLVFLSINNYYHAVFDFKNQAGYCRNAFPEAKKSWTKVKQRKLTDELILELSKSSNP